MAPADKVTMSRVRSALVDMGYTHTRVDRMVHNSEYGFMDGEEMRSISPGSNAPMVLRKNAGATGPLAIETGYGSNTIRIRMFIGYRLQRTWDVQTSDVDGWLETCSSVKQNTQRAIRQIQNDRDTWAAKKEGDA